MILVSVSISGQYQHNYFDGIGINQMQCKYILQASILLFVQYDYTKYYFQIQEAKMMIKLIMTALLIILCIGIDTCAY